MPKAILTGASSGIGHALARELAGRGYALGLMARRSEPLEQLQKILPVSFHIQLSDFLNPESALADFKRLWESMDGADLVILNAGVNSPNAALSWEDDRSMLDVNVRSFTALADEAARFFLKRRAGHLVGISSIAGTRGSGKAPVYGATKAYVSNFLQGLRQRLSAECPAIAVTDVRPGFVDTPMIANAPFKFWAAPPEKAARQIAVAIQKRKKMVYVTRRWAWVALLYRLAPECLIQQSYEALFKSA